MSKQKMVKITHKGIMIPEITGSFPNGWVIGEIKALQYRHVYDSEGEAMADMALTIESEPFTQG